MAHANHLERSKPDRSLVLAAIGWSLGGLVLMGGGSCWFAYAVLIGPMRPAVLGVILAYAGVILWRRGARARRDLAWQRERSAR